MKNIKEAPKPTRAEVDITLLRIDLSTRAATKTERAMQDGIRPQVRWNPKKKQFEPKPGR